MNTFNSISDYVLARPDPAGIPNFKANCVTELPSLAELI